MDKVAIEQETFEHACAQALAADGCLSHAIPGFVPRTAQQELALAIAKAIEAHSILVSEAGTGTGKTFAYLVPALLSGKKIIISTATKTLQDQLFQKDLPQLLQAIALPRRVQNLKGRANYLCRYRIALYAEQGRFMTSQCSYDMVYVHDKLAVLSHGERFELPEISEDAEVWPYITSTVDNCLGTECAYYNDCFLVKARRRALEADVVIINHHLYFSDFRLKDEGFGELLPQAALFVFDEAHHLMDVAAQFYGQRVGTRQFQTLMDDTLGEWPVLDLANQPLKKMSDDLDKVIDALLGALSTSPERMVWKEAYRAKQFMLAYQDLLELSEKWLDCYSKITEDSPPGVKRCYARLQELVQALKGFEQSEAIHIRWVERFKRHLVFHATPLDVSTFFQAQLQSQEAAYVFISATLTIANNFSCFTKPLGITDFQALLLPSPFDFEQQTVLYLPRGLPDPKNPHYYEALVHRTLPVIEACGGRCFMLFTSHRALKEVAQYFNGRLPYPLLIQGEEAKPILLARFRQLGNAVLLGTASFWEGVDVKGEALSCVIIDKLPFPSPQDPVVRSKMDYLNAKGGSGFDELALPNTVLALKQGVGRLIRDEKDKGVLVIADPRLTGRDYGSVIFQSLPPLRKTRNLETVLDFIKNMMLINNESISH